MLALRGRNAAVLPSLSAGCTSDGLDTRSARAHRANARAGPINPSADLAGQATRLGLEVKAKNPRQDFDQPGCQDGLRLTLTVIESLDEMKRKYEAERDKEFAAHTCVKRTSSTDRMTK